MIKAVIFDMDDTLYDEIDYCMSGFRAVAGFIASNRANQVCCWSAEEIFTQLWSQFCTGDRRKVFNNALEELKIGISDEFISQLIEVYRNHKPDITLPADSRAVLDELSKKYKLGLITDGFLPSQELKVQALAIEKYFGSIVYTEKLGRQFWKPAVKGFELACEELSSSYQESVYVADNILKDFIAPNKLGFRATIKIVRKDKIHRDESIENAAKPTHEIDNLSQLSQLLKTL